MKIKHYQGYGTVNAEKISDKNNILTIRVTGNHEYGLYRDDRYDVFRWLVKRFKKNLDDPYSIKILNIDNGYIKQNGLDVETAVYTIAY